MENALEILSIEQLFSSGEYVIPIYQRNYAWGEAEINQLIRDIYDFSKNQDNSNKDYFIGSLVVFERKENDKTLFETIDGQQRLTTLNILLSVLHREFHHVLSDPIDFSLNLRFDSRKKSTRTIQLISSVDSQLAYQKNTDYTSEMQQAYEICIKQLNTLLKEEQELSDFYQYLVQQVKTLRVSVPEDTNLNHYFEVMNTRGEQLEKHEVLKARMMSKLSADHDKYVFNRIWEACSDMERYVQYGFVPKERNKIFGNRSWDQFDLDTFDELTQLIESDLEDREEEGSGNQKPSSIQGIVGYQGSFHVNEDHKEDAPERFTSVINFQNFLLHVLRIQTRDDISLDDKQLLNQFESYLDNEDAHQGDSSERFVKAFGFNLFKIKYIFDKFILKREFINEKEGWSLKRLKWYEDNKVSYVNTFGEDKEGEGSSLNTDTLMLLSMFHVSAPTLIYKHWLNASLLFCFDNLSDLISESYTGKSYRDYLFQLAQTYMKDRYLAAEEKDFYQMIYVNNGVSSNAAESTDIDLKKLNKGTQVENFVFNYVDYLLWKKSDINLKDFEFSFRSSVEHYYPQNPNSASNKIDQEICDMFGNLCLISRSKNSKLSNYMPTAKKEHYERVKPDSLKQQKMMQTEGKNWNARKIIEETKEMNELILESLDK